MNTDIICEKTPKVHHGLNIKRVRSSCQMKQETLASKLGVAQQTLSKYENQEVIEDEMLEKCAKALDIPADLLKNMPSSQDAPIQYFKDVNFINSAPQIGENGSQNNHLYYSEKVICQALQDEVERLKEENEKLKAELGRKQ